MADRELILTKILDEINTAYSDTGKDEASRRLDDYFDDLLADIDNKKIAAPELYRIIRKSIKTLLDNMEYGIDYYEPLLNRCISLLHKIYYLDEEYKRKIIRLLLAMHPIYNHYTNEYYRAVKRFLDENSAIEAIDLAKRVKFGPDIELLIIAYDKLNVPLEDRIVKLERYMGRYGATEYLLWLYYECSRPKRLEEFISINKDIKGFYKQVELARYYYYLLLDDKEGALMHIRRACLYDQDLKLYFEYTHDSSDERVEMCWYYDNKKYEFLLKLLAKHKYYDEMMRIIIEANRYSFYLSYYSYLLPKYNNEYKSFLIDYVDRMVNNNDINNGYERLSSVIEWIIKLNPTKEERVKLLNSIYRDDLLVDAAGDLIERLK